MHIFYYFLVLVSISSSSSTIVVVVSVLVLVLVFSIYFTISLYFTCFYLLFILVSGVSSLQPANSKSFGFLPSSIIYNLMKSFDDVSSIIFRFRAAVSVSNANISYLRISGKLICCALHLSGPRCSKDRVCVNVCVFGLLVFT